jgi:hypothetical protein
MKNGNDIEVLEVLVTVDANNNVYLTEYADVIINEQIGTKYDLIKGILWGVFAKSLKGGN